MATNVQQAREALGAHLRQLRRECGLNGKQFAARLGWQPSKVSKIEIGKQTPSKADLDAWTDAAGRPEIAEVLAAELAALESFYVEYRQRVRSGLRFLQHEFLESEARSRRLRVFEPHYVPGLLQTPEYARRIFAKLAPQYGAPDDIDEAVAVRMRRQEVLYRPGRQVHLIVTEAALRTGAVAPRHVMLAQLDRLVAATTLGGHVRFGVVAFGREWPVFLNHGFWLFDDTLVVVETVAASLRLTKPDEIEAYARAHKQMASIACYGAEARAIITRVLLDLNDESDASNGSF